MFDQRNTVYVGHLGSIPLYVHWSFLLLLYSGYRWGIPDAYDPTTGGTDYSVVIIAIMLLLAGIILHELGHGITAKLLGAFGVKITLWAMGGLCSSHRDSLPRREIPILAAGPAVSFALSALGWYGLMFLAEYRPEWVFQVVDPELGSYRYTLLGKTLKICFLMNLILGIFNSIPIYPLDGGQIVHNVLRLFVRDRLANQITLMTAFVFAAAFLAWTFHQSGSVDVYTMVLIGGLLFTAYNYLR